MLFLCFINSKVDSICYFIYAYNIVCGMTNLINHATDKLINYAMIFSFGGV